MTLPVKYRDARERIIASFDFTDIADATGTIVYYGVKGDNGEYFLTTDAIPSEELTTITTTTLTSSLQKIHDLDFDIVFNRPQNIQGDFRASVPMGVGLQTSGTPDPTEMQCIVKLVHYDGSTETVIGTGTSMVTSQSLNQASDRYMARTHLVKARVSTVKHFKAGETLRIIVEGWFKCPSTSFSHDCIIGHDPLGRFYDGTAPEEPGIDSAKFLANEISSGGTITNLSTRMLFHVPFRIDL